MLAEITGPYAAVPASVTWKIVGVGGRLDCSCGETVERRSYTALKAAIRHHAARHSVSLGTGEDGG